MRSVVATQFVRADATEIVLRSPPINCKNDDQQRFKGKKALSCGVISGPSFCLLPGALPSEVASGRTFRGNQPLLGHIESLTLSFSESLAARRASIIP
jgi:hypothetical protein